MTETLRPVTDWYDKWLGTMDTKLMCLQNNRGEYLIDKLDERVFKYMNNNCLTYDWKNHLLLITLINSARNNDVRTDLKKIEILHLRFKQIFSECG